MITVEADRGVAVIRLAHGRVNALDIELCHAITTTMRTHADAGAIVLTGTGQAFSAGVDLRRIRDGGPSYIAEFLPALNEAFLAVFDVPRPVVAAINGHAVAGGCVLAAACDLRLMSAGTIGVTELLVGIPFPLAALEIIRYAFGPPADPLVFTGATVDAATAHARGLVDEVTDPGELLTQAFERARVLAAIPAPVYAMTKEQLHRPARQLIEAGRALGDDARVLAAWRSPAAHGAVADYLERLARRPGRAQTSLAPSQPSGAHLPKSSVRRPGRSPDEGPRMTSQTDISLPGRDAPPRLESYDAERARFHLDVPERYNPVLHIVEGWAAERPDAEALVSVNGDGSLMATHTVADLARESRRMARALQALGVGKGDTIFIMLPRVPAWYFAMLGAMRIGAVPMPGPNLLTSHDIAYRIGRGDGAAAITNAAGAAKVDGITEELPTLRHRICWEPDGQQDGWHDMDALMDEAGDGPTPEDPTSRDDPLLLYFTSGTVSLPKMVLHLQTYALGLVGIARFWHDLRQGDRHWTVSDSGWGKAVWGGLFGQWHERAAVVQVALGSRPEADTILNILTDHKITSFCAPPTLYRTLVHADLKAHDLSALRHSTSAGEPLNPEVIRVWREGTGGLIVYDGYGQTETTCLVANYRAVPVRPGSMGKPMPGYEVEVVDDAGWRTPDGEVGNIAVRTEPRPLGMFAGYHKEPEATAKRMVNGWYFTGDRAARDADGYIWFEGREDDVITSSAYRIGPFEVESALVEHPAVKEAAVTGKPDPGRTEVVCAFVILAPGHSPSEALTKELQDFAKKVTAPYKYPREIHYVTELPKTVSGKIRRTQLREWLRTQVPDGVELPVS